MNEDVRTIFRSLVGCIMVAAVFIVTFIVMLITLRLLDIFPPHRNLMTLFLILILGIPTGAAFVVARIIKRRGWLVLPTFCVGKAWYKQILLIIIAGYFLTVVFGIPAVQTHTDKWAISEYKRIKVSGSPRVWDCHPYIATYAALPIIPGVIVTYHEYQLDGLYGFGGFQMFVWYGWDVIELPRIPLWLS